MRITDVTTCGLQGATPEGGWKNELRPEDTVHTLIAVHTDTDLVGIGSAFTSESLVRGAVEILLPLLKGKNPLEVQNLTESLNQATFWMGRGGSVTHTISAIAIAMWDILGKAMNQPSGLFLGGYFRREVRPYASVLMDQPAALKDKLEALLEAGFGAFKIGWGPFGRVSDALDEDIVRAARETIGDGMLAVDAGGSDAYFPARYNWAKRTSQML